MSSYEEQIKRIQEKLQQVLRRQDILQKENARLKEELNRAGQRTDQYREQVDRLAQQVEILKLSNGEMNEEEKKQFEKRINAYLKEIDRCIVMLSA